MAKRQVFYSFHFKNDVLRTQQVRNIGAIEGDTPASANEWEQIKSKGIDAAKKWIDENMNYRSCVIVLVGEQTASRPLVQYEIEKAWKDKKGLFGIYIHNLKDPNTGTCIKGANPFAGTTFKQSDKTYDIACYSPSTTDAYGDIAKRIEGWIETAIAQRG